MVCCSFIGLFWVFALAFCLCLFGFVVLVGCFVGVEFVAFWCCSVNCLIVIILRFTD